MTPNMPIDCHHGAEVWSSRRWFANLVNASGAPFLVSTSPHGAWGKPIVVCAPEGGGWTTGKWTARIKPVKEIKLIRTEACLAYFKVLKFQFFHRNIPDLAIDLVLCPHLWHPPGAHFDLPSDPVTDPVSFGQLLCSCNFITSSAPLFDQVFKNPFKDVSGGNDQTKGGEGSAGCSSMQHIFAEMFGGWWGELRQVGTGCSRWLKQEISGFFSLESDLDPFGFQTFYPW